VTLDRVRDQEVTQVLRLKVGRSKVLRTPFALTRISVADPDIADLILISEREIYINALAPGTTNITMWGKSRFTSATVTVEADLTLLKEKLHQILPKEKIGRGRGDPRPVRRSRGRWPRAPPWPWPCPMPG
jgi:pilus assembly protein CpaC